MSAKHTQSQIDGLKAVVLEQQTRIEQLEAHLFPELSIPIPTTTGQIFAIVTTELSDAPYQVNGSDLAAVLDSAVTAVPHTAGNTAKLLKACYDKGYLAGQKRAAKKALRW